MEKANDVLKYVSNVTRDPEIGTSLYLYKLLVRSMVDYGNFIYAPFNAQQILKLERGQYLGLRTALGYRNSTPTNVIIAESKIMFLSNRAKFLAKNFAIRILKYRSTKLRKSLDELEKVEIFNCYRNPLNKMSTLT